ncbi:MAG: phytanoyl-CoA dioxygenase family protein [Planctomycetota bacterium]|nr:phytanoyl-CoA dioxygenase family protein [Planctomycetota bacterium]MDA1142058.1 phytanoyl-CoA dioxygenase family protein [Planctomycetota bacterium]
MTNEQQAEYEGPGWLLIKQCLSATELSDLRSAFEQAGENSLDDLPNSHDAFIHLAAHPNALPILHRIIGDNIQLHSLWGVRCRPGEVGIGWKREVAGILGIDHPNSNMMVQALFYLDDVSEDSGAVLAVPGSQRFKNALPIPETSRYEDMPHSVSIMPQMGDALILHGNLWQARADNRSNRSIRWLRYDYIHCWMRHALPKLSAHAEEVASKTHNLSQLFATSLPHTNSSGYWGRELEGFPRSGGLPARKFSNLCVVGREHQANSSDPLGKS